MSKERTIEDIQKEYQQGALKAGHLSYQIYAFKKDLDILNNNLRDLNLEAAAIQAKAAESKKAEEVKQNESES